mmetsp:Transcript_83372/g.232505  ORF Transcript_83372/g.232505 Transcript_83372/m.232505 type:complete len:300 (+) Transcript_83372:101-1000(+)
MGVNCSSSACGCARDSELRVPRPDELVTDIALPQNPSMSRTTNGDDYGNDEGGAEVERVQYSATSLGKTYFDREIQELSATKGIGYEAQEERPTYTFGTGATYKGQWRGNRRHGYGVQRWADGAMYEGQWRWNNASGHGRFQYKEHHTSYIGQWRRSMAHGEGVYRDNEHVYYGNWVNDEQDGKGVETWNDGEHYEGEFVGGTKHGYGVYQSKDGSKSEGAWKDGLMNGPGDVIGTDHNFKGTWVASHKSGMGKCEWHDGRKYEGQYAKDHRDGFGVFTWADGNTQTGFWHNGEPVPGQ